MYSNKRYLILAIDDRPELLASVSEMLEEYYTVIGVKNYLDAMEVLESQTPSLFLLDIEMPLLNGYDIAALIREEDRFRNTPIIFLTSQATKDSVTMAIKSGGNSYIVKPVERFVLLKKIRKYLP